MRQMGLPVESNLHRLKAHDGEQKQPSKVNDKVSSNNLIGEKAIENIALVQQCKFKDAATDDINWTIRNPFKAGSSVEVCGSDVNQSSIFLDNSHPVDSDRIGELEQGVKRKRFHEFLAEGRNSNEHADLSNSSTESNIKEEKIANVDIANPNYDLIASEDKTESVDTDDVPVQIDMYGPLKIAVPSSASHQNIQRSNSSTMSAGRNLPQKRRKSLPMSGLGKHNHWLCG